MKNLFSGSVLLITLFSGSAFAASDVPVAIPCLNDSGGVVNANAADVCKALLPKCTDLRKEMVAQLKDMIEWKIYGYYYLNKDIKLDKISGMNSGSTPEGDPLPYPLCSVVGHKVSANDSGEIHSQHIPNGKNCGEYPEIDGVDAWSYKVDIRYDGVKGMKWFSYVLGAMPWELRRNAADVIRDLNSDVSNLQNVLHTESMNADILDTLIKIKDKTNALTADAKATCNQPPAQNIVEACKNGTLAINDPVQKLCTLAKAQLALNAVAVPNMLVYEVNDRTKKMHDQHFGNIFSGNSHVGFGKLIKHCGDNKSLTDRLISLLDPISSILKNAILANKNYSCNASCLTDGEIWYTNVTDGNGISWKNGDFSSQAQRKCAKSTVYDIPSGEPRSSISSLIMSEGWISWSWNPGGWWDGTNQNTGQENFFNPMMTSNPTNNKGFAALVEAKIRRDICPQAGFSKSGANACDSVAIGDKPCGINATQGACAVHANTCSWTNNKCLRK